MADETTTLTATVRTEFGKGAARRTRRAGQIPAVLYGHGEEPLHLALPGHETFLALKGHANALLTIKVEDRTETALAWDVQRDPIKRTIDHVDLMIIKKGEKVSVDIPVQIEGESEPGTIHTLESQTITMLVDALAIPEYVTASIEGLEDGAVVHAGAIELPAGAELESDPETAVVVISVPRVAAEDEETEAGEEAAEAEAAGSDADAGDSDSDS